MEREQIIRGMYKDIDALLERWKENTSIEDEYIVNTLALLAFTYAGATFPDAPSFMQFIGHLMSFVGETLQEKDD